MRTDSARAVRSRSAMIGARGFTLIEVMIVIVIILAIMGLVTVNLMGNKKRATRDLCEVQMRAMGGALQQFYLAFERYPTAEEGLAVLWSKESLDPEVDQNKWFKFLTESKPKDPWASDWVYVAPGEGDSGDGYEIKSNGPDKEEGTDDDISVKSEGTGDSNTDGTPSDESGDLAPDSPGSSNP